MSTGYCVNISSQMDIAWPSNERKCKVILGDIHQLTAFTLYRDENLARRFSYLNTSIIHIFVMKGKFEKPKAVP